MASLFSKIHQGEIPASTVFTQERWFGILDLFPVSPGHLLIIPTHEAALIHELPDDTLAELGAVIARGTACLRQALNCDAVSVLLRDGTAAGQEIPHVHWHLVPRFDGDQAHHFGGGSYGSDTERQAAMDAMVTRLQAAW
ncbi:MAG: HIT family protein [Planctomycetota bacterium]|jgi:histidine triad (HIT) family protein|nr:HIT family protein [Planctomycetota bacterium]